MTRIVREYTLKVAPCELGGVEGEVRGVDKA